MRFTWHMMKRSLTVRRRRSYAALAAVTVAATIATALLNLYADTHAKLAQEFRGYGANIVLSGDSLDHAQLSLKPNEVAVPLAYAPLKTSNNQPLVVVGTDMAALLKVNGFWKVEVTSGDPDLALGAKAGSLRGSKIEAGGTKVDVNPGRILTTGDGDESRLFMPLGKLRALVPEVHVNTIMLLSPGAPEQVNARIAQLRATLPGIMIEPVRNVVSTQLSVLGRMHAVMILASLVICVIASLSLWSSLSAAVLERRKDYAVLKALGASDRSVTGFFLLEQALLGLTGACVGYLLGCGVSATIGYYNFHAPVYPRLAVLPWVIVTVAVIVLIGAVIPLQRLQKIRPAAILKGE